MGPRVIGPPQSLVFHIPNFRSHAKAWESVSPRGHATMWVSVSPTRGATPKRGSPYPPLQGPPQSLAVRILHSRGGIQTPTLCSGPASGGYGLPRFGMAPRVGDIDSHALVWPLKLGIRTPMLWRGPSSAGYGLPRFGVAPRAWGTHSHASAWPLKFGIRTPMLWCGPLSWG